LRAKHCKHLRNNKLLNKKLFLINWLKKKSKDKLKSKRMNSSKRRSQMPRKRDKTKKFSQRREPRNSRSFKRRKPPKNLRQRKWNKNSYLHKLSKRPKLLPLRKLPPRQTSLE
jgi:hypothetical protein